MMRVVNGRSDGGVVVEVTVRREDEASRIVK